MEQSSLEQGRARHGISCSIIGLASYHELDATTLYCTVSATAIHVTSYLK